MKKILCCLLTVAILLSLSTTAFAADSQIAEDGLSSTSTINYVVDDSYIIIIPESINANYEYTFTADMMRISDNHQVNVYCTELKDGGYITLTNDSGETVDFTFNNMQGANCVAAFTKGQTTSSFSIFGGVVNDFDKSAGSYTGTATFTVRLVSVGDYNSY